MEKERNRNLMLYEFKCGHSAAAATRNICRIEGAGTVKESTCRRWFAIFRTGKEGLRDKNRSGRPLAYNLEDFVACQNATIHLAGVGGPRDPTIARGTRPGVSKITHGT
jgi:transposase